MARLKLDSATTLPHDGARGALAGRVWRPDASGPSIVAIRSDGVFDVTRAFPTMRDLCEMPDPARALADEKGERIGDLDALLLNTVPDNRDDTQPWLLAPNDLQAIKAAGVTFAISMLERVIEERAKGDPAAATGIREQIVGMVGEDFSKLVPGSPEAMRLKQTLIEQNSWSQYLEVGIGPDAEIFTKAPPMSAVGTGVDAGLHPMSTWNNPEPEAVLVVSSTGKIVGATLGNDVNLRDVEGRSALLLAKCKDNNASATVGPCIRFFDNTFSVEDLRQGELTLVVEGPEGYRLEGHSSLGKISRSFEDLAGQMLGKHHQYPDGAILYTGTLFAPIDDRDAPGQGFTHKIGDIVTIATPWLGSLVNRMQHTDKCPPWTFGASHLMRSLARRGLL